MEELALKHEFQQQEGRYIKVSSYPKAASEKEADRMYRKQATEMAADMMKAGTIADSAHARNVSRTICPRSGLGPR